MKNEEWHKWFAWYPIKYAGEFYWLCYVWRRWSVGAFFFSKECYIYYPADNRKPSKAAIKNHNKFNKWLRQGPNIWGDPKPLIYSKNKPE